MCKMCELGETIQRVQECPPPERVLVCQKQGPPSTTTFGPST